MGYTHYWRQYRDFTDEEWDYAREFFHKGLELLSEDLSFQTTAHDWGNDPVSIRGPQGTGEPLCNENEIGFNGCKSLDLDHESFYVQKIASGYVWSPTQRFFFCKTARKPYDVLVVAMLMMFHEMNPWFEWSSDGGDQHAPAMDGGRRLYNAIVEALCPWPNPGNLPKLYMPISSVVDIKIGDIRTEHRGAKYDFINWPPKPKEKA